MFIYKFTNIKNGKEYIGKWTSTIGKLHYRYIKEINDNNCERYIINSLRKNGIDNFKFEIIKETNDANVLKELEKHFVNFFNTFQNGYNLTPGGDGGSGSKKKGRKVSEETRLKMSLAKKGKPANNKGVKASKETREKQRQAKLGKKANFSKEYREQLRERITNYNQSEQGRLKSSETGKLKVGENNPNFGKPRSIETKTKIGNSVRKTKSLQKGG